MSATPKSEASQFPRSATGIERELEKATDDLSSVFGGANCYLLIADARLTGDVVNDIYDDLRDQFGNRGDRLVVVVDSGGGDIHAAFNLAQLLRRYGDKELLFVVPRWAKSAATLLVCAGDKILMAPPAELGPLDPQITEMNPLENRLEQFSPIDIESTLELIRDEFAKGSDKLADGLLKRLQFPLTLGSFKKSLEISRAYLEKLLVSRMLTDDVETAKGIAKKLSRGYETHGYCIHLAEATSIGLKVEELEGDALQIAWRIHRLDRHRHDIDRKKKQRQMEKKLKSLPPEVLKRLPSGVTDLLKGVAEEEDGSKSKKGGA